MFKISFSKANKKMWTKTSSLKIEKLYKRAKDFIRKTALTYFKNLNHIILSLIIL